MRDKKTDKIKKFDTAKENLRKLLQDNKNPSGLTKLQIGRAVIIYSSALSSLSKSKQLEDRLHAVDSLLSDVIATDERAHQPQDQLKDKMNRKAALTPSQHSLQKVFVPMDDNPSYLERAFPPNGDDLKNLSLDNLAVIAEISKKIADVKILYGAGGYALPGGLDFGEIRLPEGIEKVLSNENDGVFGTGSLPSGEDAVQPMEAVSADNDYRGLDDLQFGCGQGEERKEDPYGIIAIENIDLDFSEKQKKFDSQRVQDNLEAGSIPSGEDAVQPMGVVSADNGYRGSDDLQFVTGQCEEGDKRESSGCGLGFLARSICTMFLSALSVAAEFLQSIGDLLVAKDELPPGRSSEGSKKDKGSSGHPGFPGGFIR